MRLRTLTFLPSFFCKYEIIIVKEKYPLFCFEGTKALLLNLVNYLLKSHGRKCKLVFSSFYFGKKWVIGYKGSAATSHGFNVWSVYTRKNRGRKGRTLSWQIEREK